VRHVGSVGTCVYSVQHYWIQSVVKFKETHRRHTSEAHGEWKKFILMSKWTAILFFHTWTSWFKNIVVFLFLSSVFILWSWHLVYMRWSGGRKCFFECISRAYKWTWNSGVHTNYTDILLRYNLRSTCNDLSRAYWINMQKLFKWFNKHDLCEFWAFAVVECKRVKR